jgi:hypothetical protein
MKDGRPHTITRRLWPNIKRTYHSLFLFNKRNILPKINHFFETNVIHLSLSTADSDVNISAANSLVPLAQSRENHLMVGDNIDTVWQERLD